MMKISYLFMLLAVILNSVSVQAQWNLEKCPTINSLNAVSFTDVNTGWIVGDKGTILYRSGGKWKEYEKLTSEDLNSLFLVDNNDGWSVGDNGTILHFNGKKWEPFYSPTSYDLFSVTFKDYENGIAVGDFGTILVYKNGNWNLMESGVRGSLHSVFYETDEAWIGGGLECINMPIIKLGTSRGVNTIVNLSCPYATIKSLAFVNPDNGWAVGSPSAILHFNGTQWEKVLISDDYSSLSSVFFSDENKGICVGYGGTVMIYSVNGWNREILTTTKNLNGTAIIDSKYYAVGDSGTIITRDLISYSKSNDIYPGIQNENKVYPNPCDDFLNIVIPCYDDDITVLISVNNIAGEIIMQKELKLGTINLTYPLVTRDFKNGFYLIKMTVEGKTTTNKFIVRH